MVGWWSWWLWAVIILPAELGAFVLVHGRAASGPTVSIFAHANLTCTPRNNTHPVCMIDAAR